MVEITPLQGRELAHFGTCVIANQAFDAIRQLLTKRMAAGMTVEDIAKKIGHTPRWVHSKLSGPGQWNLYTIGALTQALDGEVELQIVPLETPREMTRIDAYERYFSK